MQHRHPAVRLFILFALTLTLIWISSWQLNIDIGMQKQLVSTGFISETHIGPGYAITALIYIIIISAILILFIKTFKTGLPFYIIEVIAFLISFPITIYLITEWAVSLSGDYVLANRIASKMLYLSFPLGIVILFLRYKMNIWTIKNVIAISTIVGLSTLVGFSLKPTTAVLLGVLLAIYDYIAVFKTKHMKILAEYVIKTNAALTVTTSERASKRTKGKIMKGRSVLDMGTGDFAIPGIIIATLSNNPAAAFTVFVGSLVGFVFTIIYLFKRKSIIPALPPIMAGILISIGGAALLGIHVI